MEDKKISVLIPYPFNEAAIKVGIPHCCDCVCYSCKMVPPSEHHRNVHDSVRHLVVDDIAET